jgi:putative membrane protein
MGVDLVLAIVHHLGVFTVAAIIAAEWALVRSEMNIRRIRQLSTIDTMYGIAAALVLLVGFARVFFGLKGSAFYMQNPVFWAKVGAFIAIGVLSVPPTLLFLTWRNHAKTDPSFIPAANEVASVRRYVMMEAHIFVLIPILAAAMARGYGL